MIRVFIMRDYETEYVKRATIGQRKSKLYHGPFNGCLQCLSLHAVWLPDGEFVHVRTLSCGAVNSPS